MDVHLGMEGTNSNGHGEERNENMNMVETIKNLQKDVQSHMLAFILVRKGGVFSTFELVA